MLYRTLLATLFVLMFTAASQAGQVATVSAGVAESAKLGEERFAPTFFARTNFAPKKLFQVEFAGWWDGAAKTYTNHGWAASLGAEIAKISPTLGIGPLVGVNVRYREMAIRRSSVWFGSRVA